MSVSDAATGRAGEAGGMRTLDIALDQIRPDAEQPRKELEREDHLLNDLAASIAVHGMLQPITVRLVSSGIYQIVSGERRWRAARLAGLQRIPCIVRSGQAGVVEQMVENLQRLDMTDLEIAAGLQRLRRAGLKGREIVKLLGKSEAWVSRYRLLEDPVIVELMEEEVIGSVNVAARFMALDPADRRSLLDAGGRITIDRIDDRRSRAASPNTLDTMDSDGPMPPRRVPKGHDPDHSGAEAPDRKIGDEGEGYREDAVAAAGSIVLTITVPEALMQRAGGRAALERWLIAQACDRWA